MDSVPLEMDDIFAEHEEEEDDFPAPLPDLPQELEPLNTSIDNMNPSQDTENAEVLAKLKDLSKGAARKIVKRPVPKLDSARLTGDRGIPILPQVFKDITFKGKGHEAEDLKMVMGKLEHWAHRLFPKMPFDEVLERIEKLGCKKEVQTCIKKMRLDMPLLDEDFVRDEEEDLTTEPAANGDGQTNGPVNELDQDAEEAFDEMMRASGEETNNNESTPLTLGRASQVMSESVSPRNVTSPAAPPATPRHSAPTSSATATVQHTPATPSNGLTPDQMEHIERNRRLAMEKRKARLQTTESATSVQPTVSGQMSAVEDQRANNSDDVVSAGNAVVSSLSRSNEATSQPTVSGQTSTAEDRSTKKSNESISAGTVSSSSQKDTSTSMVDSRVLDTSDNLNYHEEVADSTVQVTSGDNQLAASKDKQPVISAVNDNCSEKLAVEDEEQMADSDPEDKMQVSVDGPQEQSPGPLTSDVMSESTSQDQVSERDNNTSSASTDGVRRMGDTKLTEGQKELTSTEGKVEKSLSETDDACKPSESQNEATSTDGKVEKCVLEADDVCKLTKSQKEATSTDGMVEKYVLEAADVTN